MKKYVLSAIAAWSLAVACDSAISAAEKSIPFYSQNDSRWSAEKLGNSTDTIGMTTVNGKVVYGKGCALTSAAMILRYRGASVDRAAVTPKNLNAWLIANGGFDGGQVRWQKIADVDGPSGLTFVQRDASINDVAQLKTRIDRGELLIIKTLRYGGHYVTVTGYVGSGTKLSDFRCLDSESQSATSQNMADGAYKFSPTGPFVANVFTPNP